MVAPGQVIAGKYRVERLLGEGGMGSVWVATNEVLQKRVALKVMGDDFRSHPDWVKRFFREGVAASKAKHPGVVEVYDAGDHEGSPWMAMELLEGESLRERLSRQGRMSPEDTVRILREVLDALAAVHAVGIVHRDLKPDNVFVERTPHGERAKVLDFGIAKEAESIHALTQTGTIVGTAHYLAPEQARDSKTVDPRTDLYAIGVMLFECLSGQMPYDAATVPELIAKMYSEPPRDLGGLAPNVSDPLRRVVHACLARDPNHRPADARALVSMLDGAVHGPRTATGPVSSPNPAWQQAGFAPTVGLGSAAPPSSPMSAPPHSSGAPVMAPSPAAASKSSPWPWIIGGLVLLALFVVVPVVAVVGLGLWTAATVIENSEGLAEGLASSALDFDLPQGGRSMMLVDVNGDGVEDVVGSIMRFDGGSDSVSHFAAYDGTDGHRLWISQPLGTVESRNHSEVALAGSTLLLATGAGELHGYDARDGHPMWHFNVGERPEHFCAADAQSAILVTADERRTRVTLTDGTARPEPEGPCSRLMGDHVQDFSTGSIAEPPWQLISRWDAREVDVDGMSVSAAFTDGARTFAFGTRDSGTRIPRAALVDGWQIDVPGVSPLRAEATDPEAAYIARDQAFLAYAMEGEEPARLTGLSLADGARVFDVPLTPSNFDPQYVQAGANRIAVGHGGHVDVFDREGRPQFHLGR